MEKKNWWHDQYYFVPYSIYSVYIYIAAFYVFLGEIKQSFQNLTMAMVKFVDKVLKIDIKSIGTECVFSLLLHVIQHYNALVSVNCLF